MFGKKKSKKEEDRTKKGGAISNMIRNKMRTYQSMEETIGLDPRAKKEYEKLLLHYPDFLEDDEY